MTEELDLFDDSGINVLWQNFNHASYPQFQFSGSFLSHMSFIDYLFNCGLSDFTSYLSSCPRDIMI